MRIEYVDEKSMEKANALLEKRTAEAPIKKAIKRGDYPLLINADKQKIHMESTAKQGRSVITIPVEELQEIVNAKAGSGKIEFKGGRFEWTNREIVDAEKEIGYTINRDGVKIKATSLKIHYSKTGTHAVPYSGRWKK